MKSACAIAALLIVPLLAGIAMARPVDPTASIPSEASLSSGDADGPPGPAVPAASSRRLNTNGVSPLMKTGSSGPPQIVRPAGEVAVE